MKTFIIKSFVVFSLVISILALVCSIYVNTLISEMNQEQPVQTIQDRCLESKAHGGPNCVLPVWANDGTKVWCC